MKGLHHPLTGASYERDEAGTIVVTKGDLWGRFKADGTWLDGALRDADPQMCGWVAGPQIPHHRIAHAAGEEPAEPIA